MRIRHHSRADLRDHLGDAFRKVEALRKLRVDEQTDFHDGFFPIRYTQLILNGPTLNLQQRRLVP